MGHDLRVCGATIMLMFHRRKTATEFQFPRYISETTFSMTSAICGSLEGNSAVWEISLAK